MKKRIFLAIALIAASLLLFSSCSKDKRKILYVYNWSYYTPDEVIESFEKEYDCKVVMDYFASNEEMFAKVMASGGGGYDVIFPSGDYTSIMIKLGMLEEIDLTRIPNSKYITELVRDKASYDHEMKYSVPYFMGAAGIAVNKNKISDYERSWSIFSRKDLRGRMCMMDDMREVIGDALIYLGYSCNTSDDKELKEAFELIRNEWSLILPSSMLKALQRLLHLVNMQQRRAMQKHSSKSFQNPDGVKLTSSYQRKEALCI